MAAGWSIWRSHEVPGQSRGLWWESPRRQKPTALPWDFASAFRSPVHIQVEQLTRMTDHADLAEFVKTRSATAFAGLVRRHVDLVYTVSRRMAGDAHSAEDVTQAVFIVLAR